MYINLANFNTCWAHARYQCVCKQLTVMSMCDKNFKMVQQLEIHLLSGTKCQQVTVWLREKNSAFCIKLNTFKMYFTHFCIPACGA